MSALLRVSPDIEYLGYKHTHLDREAHEMDAEEIARRIATIREDRKHGATQIAAEAAELIARIASDYDIPDSEFLELFPHAVQQVGRARPNTAPLLNGAASLLNAWNSSGGPAACSRARRAVVDAAEQWMETRRGAADAIADRTARVVLGSVITLGYSSTVIHALKTCWERDLLSGVIVAESRPNCEGKRTAAELAADGVPVALITDAQMGLFVSMANAAAVGADTLMAGGAVVNKAGTSLLAMAARRAHVPFYVLADTQKIAPAPSHHRRMSFTIEEHDPEEVLPGGIEGVAVRNSHFDLTPGRYVTGYITEDGLLTRKEITARARHAPGCILLG